MKNFILIFIINIFSITIGNIVAQHSDSSTEEQILVLESGMLLKGEVERVDKRSIRFSKEDESFVLKRKNVRLTLPGDIFSNKEIETESIVIFKSNEWLITQIIELNQYSVVLKSNDVTFTFPTSEILKIYPAGQEGSQSENFLMKTDAYNFLDLSSLEKEEDQKGESKIYNITYVRIPLGVKDHAEFSFEDRSTLASLGVQHAIGYNFSQYFGLGLNLGYAVLAGQDDSPFCGISDCTFVSSDRDIDVIFSGIDVRGELSKKKLKPYYNIGFGINKALRGRALNSQIAHIDNFPNFEFDKKASKSKLGWQLQPAIGFQADMKSMELLVDFGFQLANVNFENGWFDFEEIGKFHSHISNIEISNFVLRVGVKL